MRSFAKRVHEICKWCLSNYNLCDVLHFGSQSDLFNKLVYLLRIWFREWDLVF